MYTRPFTHAKRPSRQRLRSNRNFRENDSAHSTWTPPDETRKTVNYNQTCPLPGLGLKGASEGMPEVRNARFRRFPY